MCVALAHVIAISSLLLSWSGNPPPIRPEGVKVALASLPKNAQVPTQPKKPSPPQKVPDRPTKPTPPKKPDKPTWKARSAEDIRKELAEATNSEPATEAPKQATPSNENLNQLVDDFAKAAHATTVIGEPVAIPDTYTAQVRQIIYETWKQPTKGEVPAANQLVGIRLEIQSDGRVSNGSITQRSKSLVMNQSVKALLNALQKLPPLPESYVEEQLRLDIILRLQ